MPTWSVSASASILDESSSGQASSSTWDGTPYTADEWISEVYVRGEGHWRCALSHKTAAKG